MGSTPQRKFYVCSVSLETKPLLTLCDWVQVPCLTFNWCSLVADYYWVLLSCPKWISWWGMEKWVIPFSLCLREFIISFLYFHSFILIIWAVYLTRDKPLFVNVYSRGVCLVCSICYWKYFFHTIYADHGFPSPNSPQILHTAPPIQFHAFFTAWWFVCFPMKNSCFFNNSDFRNLTTAPLLACLLLAKLFFLQCPGLSWSTVVVPISLGSYCSKKPNRAL